MQMELSSHLQQDGLSHDDSSMVLVDEGTKNLDQYMAKYSLTCFEPSTYVDLVHVTQHGCWGWNLGSRSQQIDFFNIIGILDHIKWPF